jgi:phosphatidylglycerol:prolipoprotein diacylglycerol transferase
MTLASSPIIHHPWVIQLGPLPPIMGFGIAVMLSFFIAGFISERELLRRGQALEAAAVQDVLFASIVGTLIGGRLYYVMLVTKDWGDLFGRAGFVYWGGFIGAVIACFLTIRMKKLPFARFADVAGIAIAAGYAIGRTGCWAVGDDYGKPSDGPFAVAFPEGAPPSTVENLRALFGVTEFPAGIDVTNPTAVVGVHPTQLLQTALGFVMFLVLWRMREHRHRAGYLFGAYCVLAGIERFISEFYRAKDDRFFGPSGLTLAQLIAIGIAIGGVAIMTARRAPAAPASAA